MSGPKKDGLSGAGAFPSGTGRYTFTCECGVEHEDVPLPVQCSCSFMHAPDSFLVQKHIRVIDGDTTEW